MVKTTKGWEINGHLEMPTEEEMADLFLSLSPDWENQIGVKAINQAFNVGQWRFRASAYLSSGGKAPKIAIRKLPSVPIPLHNLGLPTSILLLIEAPRGILLVSGGTGNGKSTTMGSILQQYNVERQAHIVTIEDPIEYEFVSAKSLFSQREVGVDVASFPQGVWEAMRLSPNIVMIGEIRERETAAAALQLAESGHFVIASVHANSAPGTVQKMLSFFPDDERLARLSSLQSSLVGVINQVLLPKADGSGYVLASEVMCNHKGQVSAKLNDPAALRKEIDSENDGHMPLVKSLAQLVKASAISKPDAAIAAGPEQHKLANLI